jgi:predicted Rossmann fold flavoprotein
MKRKRIIVAGAGAAGMCAAINAAWCGAQVTVIEKTDTPGRKISMTGNGRCNLSNEDESAGYYNPEVRERMEGFLSRFGTADTIEFFSRLGVVVQSEEGYLYPISGQAVTVQMAMIREMKRCGVKIITGEQLRSVTAVDSSETAGKTRKKETAEDTCFKVRTTGGEYTCDAVILATGGLAGPKSTGSTGDGYYIAEKAGLKCTDRYPALVPLLSDDPRLPQKSGVRMLAEIRLLSADQGDHGGKRCVALEYGEVQLTSNGVSGIPALQLSRYVEPLLAEGRKVDVSMDFFPAYDDEEFRKLCEKIHEVSIGTGRTLMEVLDGFSNHYLGEMVLAGSGIARGRSTEKKAHDLRRHNYGGSGIAPDRVLEEKDRDLLLGILYAYRNV